MDMFYQSPSRVQVQPAASLSFTLPNSPRKSKSKPSSMRGRSSRSPNRSRGRSGSASSGTTPTSPVGPRTAAAQAAKLNFVRGKLSMGSFRFGRSPQVKAAVTDDGIFGPVKGGGGVDLAKENAQRNNAFSELLKMARGVGKGASSGVSTEWQIPAAPFVPVGQPEPFFVFKDTDRDPTMDSDDTSSTRSELSSDPAMVDENVNPYGTPVSSVKSFFEDVAAEADINGDECGDFRGRILRDRMDLMDRQFRSQKKSLQILGPEAYGAVTGYGQ